MTGFISEDVHVYISDSAKINRVLGGFTIPPLDRIPSDSFVNPRKRKKNVMSAQCIGSYGGPAKIYRDQEGVAILPSGRPFCYPGLQASTLKSASVIGCVDGWTDTDSHHCEFVTSVSPTHRSVRHLTPKTAGNIGTPVMVNGSSKQDTRTKPVPRAGNQRISTEQTVTHGPANRRSRWFSDRRTAILGMYRGMRRGARARQRRR